MNKNIIEIPKEIFENIFFQDGGTKEEKLISTLAGGVQYGMDKEAPIAEPNAELEKGEWILDSEGLRVVIGDTHKDGGEDMVLEDGAQILSNYLEAPKSLINSLNKEHGTKIKPKSTYAEALSQVYKKIGLDKLQNEQATLIEKVKFQQENTKDANTQMMNIELLSNKIKEIEDKKQPLQVKAEEAFSKLFEKQEASKPKDKVETNEEGQVFAQNGLWFQNQPREYWEQFLPKDLSNVGYPQQNQTYNQWNPQQNTTSQPTNNNNKQWVEDDYQHFIVNKGVAPTPVPVEPVPPVVEEPQIETPITVIPGSWQILNQQALPQYGHQNPIYNGAYGSEVNKALATQETKRIFPSLSSKYFTDDSILPNNPEAFQKDINNYYSKLLGAVEKKHGKDSEKYKQISTFINQNNFVNDKDNVRYTDNKYGNYTSTRPNIALELIPEDEYKKLQAEGINTAGQLKTKYPELYKQYVSQYDAPDDLWLAPIGEVKKEEVVVEAGDKKSPEKQKQVAQDRVGVFNAPDQTPMLPTALEAHLKTNRRYERADFTAISPEAQLQEIARNQVRAEQNLDLLPSSVKAGVLANMGANVSEIANKAISQVQQVNNQAFQNIQNYNRQVQNQEENASAQDALNFEQRQLLAKARTENDIANWFNTNQRNQLRNFDLINNLNWMNANADNFQFTDRGIEERGSTYDLLSKIRNTNGNQLSVTPEQMRTNIESVYGKDFLEKLSKKPKNSK